MCLATHILLNLYAKEPWHGMKIYDIYEVGISWQSGGIPVRTSGGGGRLEGGSDTYAARLQIALTGWFLELQPEALAVITSC